MSEQVDPAAHAAWAYENLHVAALFRQWVDPVLAAAGAGPGDRVLDVSRRAGGRGRVGRPGALRGVSDLGAVAGPSGGQARGRCPVGPFLMGDTRQLRAIVSQAGAGEVSVETRRGTAAFPSVRSMVEADLRSWLPAVDVHLDEVLIESILG